MLNYAQISLHIHFYGVQKSARKGFLMRFVSFCVLDVAKKYPPSIRIIVQETNVKKLKIGELFMITYKGRVHREHD